jgi:GT2 family glycosyltransferase
MSRVAEAYHKRGWAGLRDGVSDWVGRRRVSLRLALLRLGSAGGSRDRRSKQVIIFSGEPNTPGHTFRVERLAHALESIGYHCHVSHDSNKAEESLATGHCEVLWIWRAPHSLTLENLVVRARASGVTVLYDCDDLMFDPDLATEAIIDGIRSGKYDAKEVASHYEKVRRAMLLADAMTAPTRPLVRAMRRYFRPAFLIPNTFATSTHDASAQAYFRREQKASDHDFVRIGYASGTLTHQRDFGRAVEAVAACLRADSRVRLVLFKATSQPTLDVSEFPQLAKLTSQIEWRDCVSMSELPSEIGRFDINIAPLESGNPYVEAKSELKYFDAALARVPTVASPTHPYSTAINQGVNGFLADTPEEWEKCLMDLVFDSRLREQLGRRAYFHAIAKYSPLAKVRSVNRTISMMRGSSHDVAANFQADNMHQARQWIMPACADADLVWRHRDGRCARAAVVMPLYNYQDKVSEALDSVFAQSLDELELIVVDDASTDNSLSIVREWMEAHRERFCQVALFRNRNNSGLGYTRNRAIAEASALYTIPLDADNKLGPKCVERLLAVLLKTDAALAYPLIQHFGDSNAQMGYHDWHPLLFSSQNYIDAMAMINKSAWSDVGGYDVERTGWEDYDFNCRLVEAGYWGQKVPTAHAHYRVHAQSMVRTLTEREDNRGKIAERYRKLHPWLDIAGY